MEPQALSFHTRTQAPDSVSTIPQNHNHPFLGPNTLLASPGQLPEPKCLSPSKLQLPGFSLGQTDTWAFISPLGSRLLPIQGWGSHQEADSLICIKLPFANDYPCNWLSESNLYPTTGRGICISLNSVEVIIYIQQPS